MNQSILGLTYDYIKEIDNYLLITRESPIHYNELEPISTNMIRTTFIPNLLPLEIEEMNMNIKLRYNIASKRMLSQSLKVNKMSIQEYYNLLLQITCVIDDSRQYMLSEKNYIIHEQFIFLGLDYSDIELTYLPLKHVINKSNLQDEMRTLAINLISSIHDLQGNGIQEVIDFLGSNRFSVSGLKSLFMNLINQKLMETAATHLPKVLKTQEDLLNSPEAELVITPWFSALFTRIFATFARNKREDVTDPVPFAAEYIPNNENSKLNTDLLTQSDATVLLFDPKGVPDANYEENIQVKQPFFQYNDGSELKQFEITADNFIIGRGPAGINFVMDQLEVSRCHVEILQIGSQYCIKDLGSKNGTFLNDIPLVSYKIYEMKEGDIVKIVSREFIFCCPFVSQQQIC
ncbi:MAG TPA: DUF6382 domain-containing protein [Bacilli bacterium]